MSDGNLTLPVEQQSRGGRQSLSAQNLSVPNGRDHSPAGSGNLKPVLSHSALQEAQLKLRDLPKLSYNGGATNGVRDDHESPPSSHANLSDDDVDPKEPMDEDAVIKEAEDPEAVRQEDDDTVNNAEEPPEVEPAPRARRGSLPSLDNLPKESALPRLKGEDAEAFRAELKRAAEEAQNAVSATVPEQKKSKKSRRRARLNNGNNENGYDDKEAASDESSSDEEPIVEQSLTVPDDYESARDISISRVADDEATPDPSQKDGAMTDRSDSVVDSTPRRNSIAKKFDQAPALDRIATDDSTYTAASEDPEDVDASETEAQPAQRQLSVAINGVVQDMHSPSEQTASGSGAGSDQTQSQSAAALDSAPASDGKMLTPKELKGLPKAGRLRLHSGLNSSLRQKLSMIKNPGASEAVLPSSDATVSTDADPASSTVPTELPRRESRIRIVTPSEQQQEDQKEADGSGPDSDEALEDDKEEQPIDEADLDQPSADSVDSASQPLQTQEPETAAAPIPSDPPTPPAPRKSSSLNLVPALAIADIADASSDLPSTPVRPASGVLASDAAPANPIHASPSPHAPKSPVASGRARSGSLSARLVSPTANQRKSVSSAALPDQPATPTKATERTPRRDGSQSRLGRADSGLVSFGVSVSGEGETKVVVHVKESVGHSAHHRQKSGSLVAERPEDVMSELQGPNVRRPPADAAVGDGDGHRRRMSFAEVNDHLSTVAVVADDRGVLEIVNPSNEIPIDTKQVAEAIGAFEHDERDLEEEAALERALMQRRPSQSKKAGSTSNLGAAEDRPAATHPHGHSRKPSSVANLPVGVVGEVTIALHTTPRRHGSQAKMSEETDGVGTVVEVIAVSAHAPSSAEAPPTQPSDAPSDPVDQPSVPPASSPKAAASSPAHARARAPSVANKPKSESNLEMPKRTTSAAPDSPIDVSAPAAPPTAATTATPTGETAAEPQLQSSPTPMGGPSDPPLDNEVGGKKIPQAIPNDDGPSFWAMCFGGRNKCYGDRR